MNWFVLCWRKDATKEKMEAKNRLRIACPTKRKYISIIDDDIIFRLAEKLLFFMQFALPF
jgi:hypothetical protein